MRNKLALVKKNAQGEALEFVKGNRCYIGCVDDMQHATVRGWVGCKEDKTPVCLKITKGDEVKLILAEESRPDVMRAGKLSHKNCGFNVKFSEFNHGQVRIDVMVQAKELIPIVPDYSQRKIFFLHIPKAAGSSVNDVITKALPDVTTYTHIEGIRDQWTEISHSAFLSGHIRYPEYAKSFSKSDFVVFSFFREPYAQLRSHMNWVRRLVEPELAEFRNGHAKHIQVIADRLSKVDFVSVSGLTDFVSNLKRNGFLGLFDNCQVRYLSSVSPNERVDKKHLLEAIYNLEQLHFVGICEYSEESQAMLLKLMNLSGIEAGKHSNANSFDYGLDINQKEVRFVLEPLVQYDLKLYKVAMELFKQQQARFRK